MTAMEEIKRLSGKLAIGGEFPDSAASDGFDVIDPATGDVIGRIPDTAEAEAEEAIAVANMTQKAWKRVNAQSRTIRSGERFSVPRSGLIEEPAGGSS